MSMLYSFEAVNMAKGTLQLELWLCTLKYIHTYIKWNQYNHMGA